MPAPHTAPLQKLSLRNEIFDLLSEQIITGKYIPGQWLRQDELATQLGVSQTPVREALDLLVSAGLAERVPYRGVRVLNVTQDDIIDIYILRLVLEIAIVRLAVHNILPEQLELINDILAQISELHTLEDISQHRRLNKHFHQTIAEASGNKQLEAQYEMASNRFPDWMLYEHIVRNPEVLEAIFSKELQEHRSIADAIAAGDGNLAIDKTLDHLYELAEDLANFTGIPIDLLREKEAELGVHNFIRTQK
jgi:GntR family transcriptional regulator, rspAB operon transcriptional repressor